MPSVFHSNPRRHEIALTDRELIALCSDASERFDALPLAHRGNSAELRRTAVPGILIQRLIPSLNSISRRRRGSVEGTARLRQEISRVLLSRWHGAGLATCHLAWDDDSMLVSEERVPPIEVIIKAALIGTPARIYHGLFDHTDRFGQPITQHAAHAPYVRFDYRNPLHDADGALLRDECMPIALAERLIDTRRAAETALRGFAILQQALRSVQLDVLDACFLFDERGQVLCYELSPDNMRVKRMGWARNPRSDDEFDKDLWRDGADGERLRDQWARLGAYLSQLDD
ncbi:MAG: phosphoribosylaminoimidazolesuccinocarboxamide synthase [Kofleriaceae bacterium]